MFPQSSSMFYGKTYEQYRTSMRPRRQVISVPVISSEQDDTEIKSLSTVSFIHSKDLIAKKYDIFLPGGSEQVVHLHPRIAEPRRNPKRFLATVLNLDTGAFGSIEMRAGQLLLVES